ncbi:MAG TPA: 50S ribosomal protein L21 [Ktedonobacterales bacterium]|jgi:large subunit ribosomal protein L21|nr:50S ribosomal protein L21 [Ktedonobacterales bacterium]
MYAVIETGGKQYRVSPGQTVEVELLPAEPGGEVAIERVLLVSTGESTLVGTPTVDGAVVTATVVREGRGDKIIVFKYHNKKRYRRTQGHRQDYTYLTVTDIQADGKSLVSDEDRKRYESQAHRAADRYERKLLAQLGGGESEIVEADEAEDETEE